MRETGENVRKTSFTVSPTNGTGQSRAVGVSSSQALKKPAEGHRDGSGRRSNHPEVKHLDEESPLREVINVWLDTLQIAVRRQLLHRATPREYARRLREADDRLLDLPIGALDPVDVVDWYEAMEPISRRTGTVSAYKAFAALRTLRTCLAWARRKGLTRINAAADLGVRPHKAEPGHSLSLTQLTRLFRHLDHLEATRRPSTRWNPGLANLVRLLILTGARLGELVHAKVDQVDEDGDSITLLRSKTSAYGPSPAQHKRVILLTPHAAQLVREQLAAAAAAKSPYLFPSTLHGKKLHIVTVAKWVRQVCDAVGLRHITSHDFRHTCATVLQRIGVRREAIRGILGHRSNSALDTYLHETEPPAVRRAAVKYETHLHSRGVL